MARVAMRTPLPDDDGAAPFAAALDVTSAAGLDLLDAIAAGREALGERRRVDAALARLAERRTAAEQMRQAGLVAAGERLAGALLDQQDGAGATYEGLAAGTAEAAALDAASAALSGASAKADRRLAEAAQALKQARLEQAQRLIRELGRALQDAVGALVPVLAIGRALASGLAGLGAPAAPLLGSRLNDVRIPDPAGGKDLLRGGVYRTPAGAAVLLSESWRDDPEAADLVAALEPAATVARELAAALDRRPAASAT